MTRKVQIFILRMISLWVWLFFVVGIMSNFNLMRLSDAQATEKEQARQDQNKRVIYRKSQDVEFDGSAVDGVVRSPDGAYLSQRRGINFAPLYELRQQFDRNIKESVDYLR